MVSVELVDWRLRPIVLLMVGLFYVVWISSMVGADNAMLNVV